MSNIVAILANNTSITLYRFRKELIDRLLKQNTRVVIIAPYAKETKKFVSMGCECIDMEVDRRGTNFISDVKLCFLYYKVLSKLRPDVVLTYTIKPNIYGGIVARLLSIPYISNITGLGTALEGDGRLKKLSIILYKIATKSINCLFFQNIENLKFFEANVSTIIPKKLIPGSGVNLKHFTKLPYPEVDTIEFVYVGRLMQTKGIEEYFAAARLVVAQRSNVKFHVCGFCEDEYHDRLSELLAEGVVEYHENLDDVRGFYKSTHCLINPSYHEGMSNVLLEAAASARPVLATKISGCKETFDEGISGFGFESHNVEDLVRVINKFLALDYETKKNMGLAGRAKMENDFSRDIVVKNYMAEIEKCMIS